MNKKVRQVIENLGWSIYEDSQYIDLRQYSPLGEDYGFSINTSNTKQELTDIINYCYDFDEEEHAEMWIENRGINDVPSSIKALLQDAEDIANMLIELAEELTKLL